MPGRSRTGSRPSRTVMSFAVYAASAIKKALQFTSLRGYDSLPETAVGGGLCEAQRRRFCDHFAQVLVVDRSGERFALCELLGARPENVAGSVRRGLGRRLRDRSGDEAELR